MRKNIYCKKENWKSNLPRLTEAAYSSSIQAQDDGKEAVEVSLCFAA